MLQHLPPGTNGISGLLLFFLLGLGTRSDLKTRKIPNRITYPFGAAAVGLNLIQAVCQKVDCHNAQQYLGGIGFQECLIGAAIVFSGMFVLFLLGCGAGDVKLMTIIGGLLGFRTAAEIWFTSQCVAAFFVLLLAVVNVVRKAGRTAAAETKKDNASEVPRRIPLAPFFAAGTLLVVAYPLFNSGKRLWDQFYSLF